MPNDNVFHNLKAAEHIIPAACSQIIALGNLGRLLLHLIVAYGCLYQQKLKVLTGKHPLFQKALMQYGF